MMMLRRLVLAAAVAAGFATPALAVTPAPGDLLELDSWSLTHYNASTGASTLVSCWSETECGTLIGSGPTTPPDLFGTDPVVAPDGGVYYGTFDAGVWTIVRIDLQTGDRTVAINTGMSTFGKWTIYPAASFFAPNVASLGGWGLATLVVGVMIGVQLRLRTTAEM